MWNTERRRALRRRARPEHCEGCMDVIYIRWGPPLHFKVWFTYIVCHRVDSELKTFFLRSHFFIWKITVWGDAHKVSQTYTLHLFMISKEKLLQPESLPSCYNPRNMIMGILSSQSGVQQFSILLVFQLVLFQSNKAMIFAKGIQPWWAKTLWYVRAKLFGLVLEVICGPGNY